MPIKRQVRPNDKFWTERTLEIFEMRMAGWTYEKIGKHQKLSTDRIRMICNRIRKAVRMNILLNRKKLEGLV